MASDTVLRMVEFTIPSSTGTQDYTISGFGTPVAYIVVIGDATADGTIESDLILSYGFSDGTRHWMTCCNDEDAQATSDSNSSDYDNGVCRVTTPGTNTVTDRATHSAFITDGVRLNWSNVAGDNKRGYIILIDAPNAHVATIDADGAAESTYVQTPGFQANLFIGNASPRNSVNGSSNSCNPNFGVAVDDSGLSYRCWSGSSTNGQSTSATGGHLKTDRLCGKVGSTGNWQRGYIIENITATQYTVRVKDGAGDYMAVLAIDTGSTRVQIGTGSCPSSIGVQTFNTDWKPAAVLLGITNYDGVDADKDHLMVGVGFADGTDEHSVSGSAQDNVGTTVCKSLSQSDLYAALQNTGGKACIGHLEAFNKSGSSGNFQIDFTSVLGLVTPEFWWLAIEEEPVLAEPSPASAAWSEPGPTIVKTVTATADSAAWSAPTPTVVIAGGIIATPSPASAAWSEPGPTVVKTVTPTRRLSPGPHRRRQSFNRRPTQSALFPPNGSPQTGRQRSSRRSRQTYTRSRRITQPRRLSPGPQARQQSASGLHCRTSPAPPGPRSPLISGTFIRSVRPRLPGRLQRSPQPRLWPLRQMRPPGPRSPRPSSKRQQ